MTRSGASPVRQRWISEQGWLNFGVVGGVLGFVAASGFGVTVLRFEPLTEILVLLHTVVGAAAVFGMAAWLVSHRLGARKAARPPFSPGAPGRKAPVSARRQIICSSRATPPPRTGSARPRHAREFRIVRDSGMPHRDLRGMAGKRAPLVAQDEFFQMV